ncbi:MAG: pyridoxamine 5'-phosphate oxidase family protein [Anaerolineales bacterium]|nr:pyridoxamine 5'-phosphate oxidase family protein [Anaerolineales bacterium]
MELAEFGRARLAGRPAYLATVRRDGSPRVHPVTPIIGGGHLFIFMEPTSPKGHDLQRDGRYAMHASVEDTGGGGGEFLITGRGALIEDAELRAEAIQYASYSPADRYSLFELTIETAFSTTYDQDGPPVRQRWRQGQNQTDK